MTFIGAHGLPFQISWSITLLPFPSKTHHHPLTAIASSHCMLLWCRVRDVLSGPHPALIPFFLFFFFLNETFFVPQCAPDAPAAVGQPPAPVPPVGAQHLQDGEVCSGRDQILCGPGHPALRRLPHLLQLPPGGHGQGVLRLGLWEVGHYGGDRRFMACADLCILGFFEGGQCAGYWHPFPPLAAAPRQAWGWAVTSMRGA